MKLGFVMGTSPLICKSHVFSCLFQTRSILWWSRLSRFRSCGGPNPRQRRTPGRWLVCVRNCESCCSRSRGALRCLTRPISFVYTIDMVTAKQIGIRFTDEDIALIAALMAKTGSGNRTDVVRLAVRKLAQAEGVIL